MSTRLSYFIGFCLVAILLITSIYLQYFQGMIPCALCTLQRATFIGIGCLFLLGFSLNIKHIGGLIIDILLTIISTIGILLAGRQIWLQAYPAANNGHCSVDLQYMLQALPLKQVLQNIFTGSAECAERGFEFLHLSMAEWALCWFIILLAWSVYLLIKKIKH